MLSILQLYFCLPKRTDSKFSLVTCRHSCHHNSDWDLSVHMTVAAKDHNQHIQISVMTNMFNCAVSLTLLYNIASVGYLNMQNMDQQLA